MKKISLQWRLTCIITLYIACLLYTYDAADERSGV